MMDIINGCFAIFDKLYENGINPFAIIGVIGITHLLKENLLIYNGKLKKMWTILTAFILGISFAVVFALFMGLTIQIVITNAIINTILSGYSTDIMNLAKDVKDHFFPEAKQ